MTVGCLRENWGMTEGRMKVDWGMTEGWMQDDWGIIVEWLRDVWGMTEGWLLRDNYGMNKGWLTDGMNDWQTDWLMYYWLKNDIITIYYKKNWLKNDWGSETKQWLTHRLTDLQSNNWRLTRITEGVLGMTEGCRRNDGGISEG